MRSIRFGPLRTLLPRLATIMACGWLALAGSAQNFTQPKVVATGNWPTAIYTADVNGDGISDLIYIDQGATANASTTHVLLNDGKGNFTQSAVLATAGSSLAVGNLSSSGHVDLAWASVVPSPPSINVPSITYARGNGDGTFGAAQHFSDFQIYTTPGLHTPVIQYVTSARILPTGAMDVLFEDTANQIVWDYRVGAIDFSGLTLGPAAGTGPISVADLNGDGYGDIVIDNVATGTANAYLYSAAGFPSGFVLPGHPIANVHSALLKDVNLDGVSDLIAEGPNGRIDVFFGNGDGTFQTTSSGGTGTLDGTTGNGGHLIAVGDFNHDGLPDALTVTPAGVSTLLGNGTAYLGLKGIYNAGPTGGSGTPSYAVADFNGDGNLDLAVDSPEGIAILFGNADGSFQTNAAFAAGQPAMSGLTGRFTSSGFVDTVVSTAATQAQFLRGNGDGTFTAMMSPTTVQTGMAGLWSVAAGGDFNGDGKLDIALTADGPPPSFTGGIGIPYTSEMPTPPSGLNVQYGNGDGTFQPPVSVTGPIGYQQTAGSPSSFYGVSVPTGIFGGSQILNRDASAYRYFGEINGTLASGQFGYQTTDTLHPHNLVVDGFLRPGIEDVIQQQEGDLFEFQNDGKQLATSIGSTPIGDLAVDGSLTTKGQLVAPQIDPEFNRVSTTLGFKAFPGAATIADLDGDGYGDLLVVYANLSANRAAPTASAPNYLYIWFGSGGGKFLTSAAHPVNPVRVTLSRNYYQVVVADVNGDGIPDLILSDGYLISVQLGKGEGTFGAETHYLAGQGINSISAGDVNSDLLLDLVVANGGAVFSNPVANLETLATNPDVNTGGITVLLNHAASLPTPSGTLTAAPEPTQYSYPFTLTANFNNLPVVSSPFITGTVTFSVDNTVVGTATLAGAIATIAVPASMYSTLAVGTHTLTGVYSGDSAYAATTLTGTHTVTQIPTTVSLLLCVDPPGSNFPCGNPIDATPLLSPITLYYGQVLDGVAIESANDLTGTLTFYSGSYVFCVLNANLQQGAQTCPPSLGYQGVGTTTDTAVYSGDATHLGSTSNGIVVTVLADSTTATVTSSVNPSTFGQLVTFTASVQGNYAPATGMVQFLDGTTAIGTATLDPTGTATFPISTLAVGTHPITAVYGATLNFNAASSTVLNQVVNPVLTPVASAVSLTSSINPSAPGQPVTFTATVTVPGPFAIVPTGSVTFLDGTTALSTVTLNSLGIATFTTSSLASGSHSMTAAYGGAAAIGGAGPVQPPNPPRPPKPFVHGMTLAGPGVHPAGARPVLPSVSAPLRAGPQPQAAAATPQILASVSAVLVQVVTYPLGEQPSGFSLTVSPVPVTLEVGGQAVLLVTVNEYSGFNMPVQLGCSGLPNEATCMFVQPTIGAGGGSTTLYLAVAAPHSCGSTTPLFVGSVAWPRIGGAVMALLVLLPGIRRRKGLRVGLLVVAGLCGLAAMSGCGNCTDLGTRPGNYTFTVSGTAGSTTQSQVVKLAVTI